MRRLFTDTVIRVPGAMKRALGVLFVGALGMAAPLAAMAQAVAPTTAAKPDIASNGLKFATSIGLTTVSLPELVGRILYTVFGLLGVVIVVLIIYAGFIWMTAQGNPEQVKRAKGILTNAVIGLGIISAAFSITYFIISALGAANGGIGGLVSGGGPAGFDSYLGGNRGTALGNGIVEYVYPEPGQKDVPRNTRISATFKQPLVLSTVFKNYDDKGTYDVADDELCPGAAPCATGGTKITAATVLTLNADNVKIIPNAAMAGAGNGTADQQFTARYPNAGALTDPAPTAYATPVTPAFSAPQSQTVTIKPVQPLGSATADVNYRVAFRGGVTGVKVWSETADPKKAQQDPAFPTAAADGGYFWSFTTGTTMDTTPPKITQVIPETSPVPGSNVLDRNQLLQIYFSESVDPSTVSGTLGAGGGFNLVEVRATCIAGQSCTFNGGKEGVVPGTFVVGNRYRTVEFTPAAPCEGVTENSCGEPVYCLPKNVRLEVIARAASVGTEPPASIANNGVVDMSGNSMDGNRDGSAQGQQGPPGGTQNAGRADMFDLNKPQQDLATVSDTAHWAFVVGSDIDLTVPVLRAVDPPVPPPTSAAYPVGPSTVPVDTEIVMTWSKVMSTTSMRTGSFDEKRGAYKDPFSTIVLRSHECAKTGTQACTAASCPCTELDAPGFYLDSTLVDDANGGKVTRIALLHPVTPFLTANDLGYTEADINAYPADIPAYLPVARAKIKDAKQNCFWPSKFQTDPGAPECTLGPGQNSCCNRSGQTDASFLSVCAPNPTPTP
ncbi:MAG: hypothetical protein RLZZ324_198 [Candidatus Parcubacteria bacterium]|jgi:hypothetical protein